MEISTKNSINCQFLDCKQPNLCVGSVFSGCSHKNWHLLRPSKTKEELNLEEKLLAWLDQHSLIQILDWFRCVDYVATTGNESLMADLFGTTTQNIQQHLDAIYQAEELNLSSLADLVSTRKVNHCQPL